MRYSLLIGWCSKWKSSNIWEKSGLNREANKERISKLQKAYRLTWNRYNKKSISRNAKLRHYNSVIKPEALYASETLIIGVWSLTKDIEKQERKIVRKIFGPVCNQGIRMKKKSHELYQHCEKISDTFRKRRMKFYAHIFRMENNSLTKRIFNLATTLKVKNKWLIEIERDLQEIGISEAIIKDRSAFRNLVNNHKFKDTPKTRTNKTWTAERKKNFSEHMKRYWQMKKAGASAK